MVNKLSCAACGGLLTDRTAESVYWGDCFIDLCAACRVLGSDLVRRLPVDAINELRKARADPDAPTTGIEARVRAWIERNNVR